VSFHSCPPCLETASYRLSDGTYSSDTRRFARDVSRGFVVVKGRRVDFATAASCLTESHLEVFIAALQRAGMRSAQPYRTAVTRAAQFLQGGRCPHCACVDAEGEVPVGPSDSTALVGGSWDHFDDFISLSTNSVTRATPTKTPAGQRDIDNVKHNVIELVNATLSHHGDLPMHDGYRSVALAIIDAVFSANAQYSGVINVLNRTRPYLAKWFGAPGEDDDNYEHVGAEALVAIYLNFEKRVGADVASYLAENLFQNRARIGGHLKAAVVREVASRLLTISDRVRGLEISGPLNTAKDFDAIWEGSNGSKAGEAIMQDLCAIPGIGVATSRYLLLLLGGPYVKPDRMTMRFVQRVLNNGNILEADTVRILEAAIQQARDEEGWSYSTPRIDHLIWRVESGRLHLPNTPTAPDNELGKFEL
jgi:hypothetical protein